MHLAREFCAHFEEAGVLNRKVGEPDPLAALKKICWNLCFFLKSMGAYLAKPKTEKISEGKTNGVLSYGVSCMQGWRVSMEVRLI